MYMIVSDPHNIKRAFENIRSGDPGKMLFFQKSTLGYFSSSPLRIILTALLLLQARNAPGGISFGKKQAASSEFVLHVDRNVLTLPVFFAK